MSGILRVVDANGKEVGEFEGGIVYMDDGSYGECTHAWLDENNYKLVADITNK